MVEVIKEYGPIFIAVIAAFFVMCIAADLFLSDSSILFAAIENFIRNTYGG